MGRQSFVYRLPPDLRHQLDLRLDASGYGDISGIAAWVSREAASRGLAVTVSRSALHHYARTIRGIGNPTVSFPVKRTVLK